MEDIERPDDPQLMGYSAPSNISMSGKIETGYTRQEWRELSGKQQAAVEFELLCELIELYEIDDESEI